MRKLALLLAFVLVMACAGGAFATDINVGEVSVAAIKDGLDPTINKIRTLTNGADFNITDSGTQQLTADDYKWIYRALFDPNLSPTADAPTLLSSSNTFVLKLGDNQTDIAPGAFKYQGYKGMTTLAFGTNNKLKTIGANAFEGTESLTTLTNVFNSTALVSIGAEAFKDSSYATDPAISGSYFTTIGTGAFAGSKIPAFTLTAPNCAEIPADAFSKSDVVTVTLTGSGVKTIGPRAFSESKLVTLVPATETTAIGDEAAKGCKDFTTLTINSGSKLATIGKSAFENCDNGSFTSVDFQNATKLTEIGDFAFTGCENLATLNNFSSTKLTTIGQYAFASTAVGTSLPFPTTLKNVGKGAFDYYSVFQNGVTNLAIVFRDGTDEPADRKITDAAGMRAFLETLRMTGAFGVSNSDQWPMSTVINKDTISIDFNGTGAAESLFDILNIAQGSGGIVDDPNNADTKAIVGILKGMGFRPFHIVLMFGNPAATPPVYALSEATVAAIAAIEPDSVTTKTHNRDDLDMLLIRADDLAKTTIGPAVGQLPQDKSALLETLKNAITAARKEYADGKLPLPTSIVDSTIWNNLDTATSNVGNNIVQPTPPPPVKSDDYRSGGSTGGSGGCAAGFAPIAALFVLGALKLRKGR